MPDRFQSLLDAIADDERAKVKQLLAADPALATSTATKARLDLKLPHWIYVGDTALHAAAAGHRVEIVRMLLASGADPRAADNHRCSAPLHYAADGCPGNALWNAGRQVRTIQQLLEAGADVQAQDRNGTTPLHRAVRTRCVAAVKCLLDAGSDASLRNKPGSTPFHLAVQNTGRGGSGVEAAKTAQREIIETFLKRSASPTLRDARGRSVRDWARSDWVRQALEVHSTD